MTQQIAQQVEASKAWQAVYTQLRFDDYDSVIDVANDLFQKAIENEKANDPLVRLKYCEHYYISIYPLLKRVFGKDNWYDIRDLHGEGVDETMRIFFESWFTSSFLEDALSNEQRTNILILVNSFKAFRDLLELTENSNK